MKKMSIQGRGNNTLASAHSQSKVKPHWNRSSNSGSRLKAQYQFGSLDVRLGCAGLMDSDGKSAGSSRVRQYGAPNNRIHCVDYLNSLRWNEVLKLGRVQFRLYRPNDTCTYSMVHGLTDSTLTGDELDGAPGPGHFMCPAKREHDGRKLK